MYVYICALAFGAKRKEFDCQQNFDREANPEDAFPKGLIIIVKSETGSLFTTWSFEPDSPFGKCTSKTH